MATNDASLAEIIPCFNGKLHSAPGRALQLKQALPDPNMMREHLEWWYAGIPSNAYLVVSRIEGKNKDGSDKWLSTWHRARDLENVIQRSMQFTPHTNVFYSVNPCHPDSTPKFAFYKPDDSYNRSNKDIVYAAPGFLGDFDGAWGTHKKAANGLPPTRDALVAFLHGLPIRPSRILDSKGGLHTYHKFAHPWMLDTPEAKRAFVTLATRFQETIKAKATALGWGDTSIFTADLPRVLRLPGTITHKYNAVVDVLEETGEVSNPADFDAWLLPAAPEVIRGEGSGGGAGSLDLATVAAHYGCTWETQHGDEIVTAHPVHGSDTGTNLHINTTKQAWYCWRHNTGGGALDFLAVCAEVIDCEQAKPGGLRGQAYLKTVEIANKEFGAGITLKAQERYTHPPLRVVTTSRQSRVGHAAPRQEPALYPIYVEHKSAKRGESHGRN